MVEHTIKITRQSDIADKQRELVRLAPTLITLFLDLGAHADVFFCRGWVFLPLLDSLTIITDHALPDTLVADVIAKCPHLYQLHYHQTRAVGIPLPSLFTIPQLRRLTIRGMTVGDRDLQLLGQHSVHLRHLRLLEGVSISVAALASFCSLRSKTLKLLGFFGEGITGEHIAALSVCRRLTTLELSKMQFTPSVIRAMKTLLYLKSVVFEDSEEGSLKDYFSSALWLKNITFDMPVSEELVKCIEETIPNLESLIKGETQADNDNQMGIFMLDC